MVTNREERWQDWTQLPVLDRNQLDNSTDCDLVFAFRVLEAYFLWIPGSLRQIQSAIENRNLKALRYNAHTAKGSSQAVGALRMACMFQELEKTEDLVEAESIARLLSDEFNQVQAYAIKVGLYLVQSA